MENDDRHMVARAGPPSSPIILASLMAALITSGKVEILDPPLKRGRSAAPPPNPKRNNPMKYRPRRLTHTPLKTGQQIREGRALLGLDQTQFGKLIGRASG